MLSAISQSKGHRTHDSTHARSLDSEFIFKFTETESRMVVSKDREGREMGRYCLMSTEFQSRQMKRFWRWAVVMVTQQCEYT